MQNFEDKYCGLILVKMKILKLPQQLASITNQQKLKNCLMTPINNLCNLPQQRLTLQPYPLSLKKT